MSVSIYYLKINSSVPPPTRPRFHIYVLIYDTFKRKAEKGSAITKTVKAGKGGSQNSGEGSIFMKGSFSVLLGLGQDVSPWRQSGALQRRELGVVLEGRGMC